MQTVRQALDPNSHGADLGVEGASNLFYYLFDDWRAVYVTVAGFHDRLDELVRQSMSTHEFEHANRSSKLPLLEIL